MPKNYTHTLQEFPLPSTEDIEMQLLYDLIYEQRTVGEVSGIVTRDMFSPGRARIWDELVKAYETGTELSVTALNSIEPNEIRIIHLKVKEASIGSGIIRDAIRLRNAHVRNLFYFQLVEGIRLASDGHSSEDDCHAFLEETKRNMESSAPVDNTVSLSEGIDEWEDEYHEKVARHREGKGVDIRTSFPILDQYLAGGFAPGQLVILAARPSVGKTAIMLQIAKQAAMDGRDALVFSMETLAKDLAGRMLYSCERFLPVDIARLDLKAEAFESASMELKPLPFAIDDATRDVDILISKATRAVKAHKCDVVFVDYLGLLDVKADRNSNQAQRLGEITKSLKQFAMAQKIPVILLAQLNRESAKESRHPQLFDLRDSGSIEQDADVVLMIEKHDDTDLILWIRKNRRGEKDKPIGVRHNESYTVFTQLGEVDINP